MIREPFRANGTQRCPCQCHPDWSWLVFGDTTINFMDVDYIAERNGYYLFIEWKAPAEIIPRGQERCIHSLSDDPRFTVMIVRGPRGEPMQIQRVRYGKPGKIELSNREDFQRRVSRWFDAVNQRPRPQTFGVRP